MMSENSNQSDTVLKWFGPHQLMHRIQVKEIPGSAHWSIVKDSRATSKKEWQRDWATEARTKPDFKSLRD